MRLNLRERALALVVIGGIIGLTLIVSGCQVIRENDRVATFSK